MSDVYDKEKRSQVMSSVRSKNSKSTELKLIILFKEYRITGWRRTYPLFGKPDFVFQKKRIVIFVDGCFWHGHDCRNVIPKEHADYWDAKRERNIERDKMVTEILTNKNWTVIRIWECELKGKAITNKLSNLFDELKNK
jgi:DNA mismatch endonuclease (patch repair protein)